MNKEMKHFYICNSSIMFDHYIDFSCKEQS